MKSELLPCCAVWVKAMRPSLDAMLPASTCRTRGLTKNRIRVNLAKDAVAPVWVLVANILVPDCTSKDIGNYLGQYINLV